MVSRGEVIGSIIAIITFISIIIIIRIIRIISVTVITIRATIICTDIMMIGGSRASADVGESPALAAL